MKKFKSFITKPFINQHGSHAKKHRGKLREETESDAPSTEPTAHYWHDGTPEGKMHLEELKHHEHDSGRSHHTSFFNYNPNDISKYETKKHEPFLTKHGLENPSHHKLHEHITDSIKGIPKTAKEKNSITEYTDFSYGINAPLAKGKPMEKSNAAHIPHLDSLISKHAFDHPTVTFHGTGYPVQSHLMNEPIIHSKGYTSSSTSGSIATTFGHTVIALHAPAGHTLFPIHSSFSIHDHEKEILHPRGMLIRPRAFLIHKYGGRNIVHATIEGVHPTDPIIEKQT